MEASVEAVSKCTKSACNIVLRFNELNREKAKSLREMLLKSTINVRNLGWDVTQLPFGEAFPVAVPRMSGRVANLVFIDQNGIKEMTRDVFRKLVSLPKTDLLFFVSSASINRFKKSPEIRKYVPIEDKDYDHLDGDNAHRILAMAYRRWLPIDLRYFLASYSIKKGPNVYGLVFGSPHPRGIEKFLNLSWSKGGDATFDIDSDLVDARQLSLFQETERRRKLRDYGVDLRMAIFSGTLRTNKEVFIFGLENGVLAAHSREIIKQMMKSDELPKQFIPISYDAWAKKGPGVPIQIEAK
jgi:three-Cys-motif partner protein